LCDLTGIDQADSLPHEEGDQRGIFLPVEVAEGLDDGVADGVAGSGRLSRQAHRRRLDRLLVGVLTVVHRRSQVIRRPTRL
jgi:hypothetical protein